MNNKQRIDQKEWLEQFSEEERERVRKLWDMSGQVSREQFEISENEIDEALSGVHNRIDTDTPAEHSGNSNSGSTSSWRGWRWMAAAAVILLVLGAGILFTPKTGHAPHGETVSLTLPDGSTIELNSGSEIRYSRLYSFTGRMITLNGEAYFSVNEGDQPFIINANSTTVRVTGTKFNVRSWSSEPETGTEVTVSEGSVEFYPEGEQNRSVTITEGQLSSWTADMEAPMAPRSVSVEGILGWIDRKLVFNDKPLELIFRELERWYDVEIRFDEAAIERETLTTHYAEPLDIESVLQDICRVKGLRYSKTANGYRVYR